MNRLRQGMIACWLAAAFTGCGRAETITWTDSPKPPADRVSDHNGFFRADPGAIRRITEKIRQLESSHGFRIYIVAEPVLMSDTAQNLAAQLQHQWLPQGNGLVVVYEGDSRSVGLGRNITSPSEAPVPPSHESDTLVRNAMAATDPALPKEKFLETLADNLVREFSGWFERRDAPPKRARTLRTALILVGMIALLSLTAIAIGALTRLKSMSPEPVLFFPKVERPERLGAPCGGHVVGRSFGKTPEE
jgi:uncharacterized membrane protein YgcG